MSRLIRQKNLAHNLKRIKHGKETVAYEYRDMDTMATIGRNKAIIDITFPNKVSNIIPND
ncbi:MAG: hypothetical protein CVT94_07685 [Bacteroidetes bacterium HGW-Bacteroidetes-11]|jgi:NADH dehydrogenase FAD-containing subunit|nr:MAG: hypothetical protein CVT94_07685 [Bacteroidetes bacterium HGW-Bacteroidetes-11]